MKAYKTKVEMVYESLQEKILSMEYKAGDRLIISQIAQEHGVSDIPVREAIRHLETEGYVKVIANHGASVCDLAGEFLEEVFMIKAVLEGYASRLSIEHLTEKDFAILRKLNEQFADTAKEGNAKKCAQLNMDFHMHIYHALPGQLLSTMLSDLWKKYSITKSVFSISPDRGAVSAAEHEKIIWLLQKKDFEAAENMVREHKLLAGRELVSELNRRKNIVKSETI
jgi:DNA-binding GntR family transcriptional regulator